MRVSVAVMLSLGLVACTQPVPNSAEGVGFQDYTTYQQSREASLAGGRPLGVAPTTGFSTAAAGAAIDAAEGRGTSSLATAPLRTNPAQGVIIGSDAPNRPRGNAPAGIRVEDGEVAAANAGISDEQDFEAVKARETIQSDAERIAQNRAQYQVVQPGELPQRPGDTGPNIVEYALATSHAPGVQMHKRSRLSGNRSAAACAKFGSTDQAQEAFLAKGGPQKDRLGVDPDGDGYACAWDPRPFRTALQ
jgi:hypothetical protein